MKEDKRGLGVLVSLASTDCGVDCAPNVTPAVLPIGFCQRTACDTTLLKRVIGVCSTILVRAEF